MRWALLFADGRVNEKMARQASLLPKPGEFSSSSTTSSSSDHSPWLPKMQLPAGRAWAFKPGGCILRPQRLHQTPSNSDPSAISLPSTQLRPKPQLYASSQNTIGSPRSRCSTHPTPPLKRQARVSVYTRRLTLHRPCISKTPANGSVKLRC